MKIADLRSRLLANDEQERVDSFLKKIGVFFARSILLPSVLKIIGIYTSQTRFCWFNPRFP